MALHPPQPRGGNAALTLASAGDRVRAFKSARRHSFLVRILKLVLPLGVILSVGGYVGLLVLNNTMTVAGIESQPPVIDTKNLTMRTPRYSGTTADGSPFTVRAREAVTDLKMSGPVRLNSIDGEIRQLSGPVTNLKATWGTYDTKTEVLELFEKIDIDGSTGMRARLTRATVHVKQNLIVSTEPVTADNETGTIRANSMTLLTKARQATFKDDVRVRLKPNAASTDPAKAAAKAKATPVTGLTANSGEPIDIKSEQLDVDDTAKTALFRRSVVARQGDATLESQELDVLYEGRASIEDPKPAVKSEVAAPEQQSRLKSVTARGNVVMVNKDDRATSETMEFDASTERVTLGGGVTLNSGTERRATARQAMLDQKADTALLTGDVFVEQARNQLKGGRLFVDRRQGKTRLDSPSGLATPAGRINALFYQGTPKSGAPAKEKAEEAPVNPLGATFKTDPTQPIVIDADTLDVTDAAKTAVFKVNVIAKQGDFTVRTSELTAHYTGQALAMAPGGTPPATKTAASAAAPATQLTRIEARQKVHITGRDGQTATSDWADFDVQANTVTMGGTVVVSQGKNVATGSRFVIDLTTGLSRFVQVPGDKPAPPAAGGWAPVAPGPVPVATPKAPAGAGGPAISAAETGTSPTCPPGVVCKSNRPSMVVYPNEMKDAAKQKSKDAGADPASAPNAVRKVVRPATGASSWDATTEPRTERRP